MSNLGRKLHQKTKAEINGILQQPKPLPLPKQLIFKKLEECYEVDVDCWLCSQSFDDMKLFAKHIKSHYNTSEDLTWKYCNKCSKTFAIKFMRHLYQERQLRPFKCTLKSEISESQCTHTSINKQNIKI
eukprot:320310_1